MYPSVSCDSWSAVFVASACLVHICKEIKCIPRGMHVCGDDLSELHLVFLLAFDELLPTGKNIGGQAWR
jgi:hypothetical protein